MVYQESLFTKEECDKIIGYSKTHRENVYQDPHIVNNRRTLNEAIGFGYDVFVILNEKNTEWIFEKLIKWFSEKSNIKINPNGKVNNCTLNCYKKGDRFPRHVDLMPGFENRRYNLGIQLNDDYDGGEYLCFGPNDEEIIISKETGTGLAYHCSVPHEIKEITKGERWSIVMPITKKIIIEKINLL
jgi:hypothetical protein